MNTAITAITALGLTATLAETGEILVDFPAGGARCVKGETGRNSVAFSEDPAVAVTIAERMAGAEAFADRGAQLRHFADLNAF
ncbi:hypothetical protein [Methylobacterium ajmalii]|jgi:hypothetical protein|uniref:hypothetical protein n=1 Tax=Methylobacterium ajmalii TaxID=2738439 RepID=UPI00190B314E|nr:hypothetical protein [Methylobacterium ajmalii]MBK3400855.1 hypothetical protein [Methylobacterium ajmalii]MBK3410930.1 hypothetical protein [Methylobacterium ajmalii]MBK3421907.1 hypothetical protein [Methylobacterium ajmalii]MBZ6415700.1 hypothetical protein [Methylobacterium sp.]